MAEYGLLSNLSEIIQRQWWWWHRRYSRHHIKIGFSGGNWCWRHVDKSRVQVAHGRFRIWYIRFLWCRSHIWYNGRYGGAIPEGKRTRFENNFGFCAKPYERSMWVVSEIDETRRTVYGLLCVAWWQDQWAGWTCAAKQLGMLRIVL